jgi:hypothetical protein
VNPFTASTPNPRETTVSTWISTARRTCVIATP